MHDDRQLVTRVLAGETGAFHELVRRYERLVRHIVFRLVLVEADAEEVCQDVFVRVYRGLRNFTGEAKLSTWIGRIAYRRALTELQRRRVRKYVELPSDSVDAAQLRHVLQTEIKSVVHRCVLRLPPDYRAAVTLYYLEEMTVAETADVLGQPEGTVKSNLYRARKLLREMLHAEIGEDIDEKA